MNIKEALDKLQSLDIEDVKNIDFTKLTDSLKQSPIIIINIALIGATIFFIVTFISKAKVDERKFTKEAVELEKKLAAVNEQKKIKKDYEEFIKPFPETITINQLIDKFSELANNRSIQILSFSSAKESSDNFLILTTVNLTIESSDYKNIILFVKDIEDFPFAVRLERFTASLSSINSKDSALVQSNNLIKADIQVSTLKIK